MAKTTNWRYAGAAAVLIFAVTAGLLVWKALNDSNAKIEMKFPTGGSLKIDAKQDLADPSALLKKLFSQDIRAGTLGLLKEQNIFPINDPDLIDAFLKQCPDKLPNETDGDRRKRWEACLQQNQLFAELKDRSDHQQPPFQSLGKNVRIGTPSDDASKPRAKHANVCVGSVFLGREILLVDPNSPPDSRRKVLAQASGSYMCPDSQDFPDVQLNDADAYQLFNRRTSKLEFAVAYPQ